MSTAAPSPPRQPAGRQVFEKQVIGLPPLRDYVRQAWARRDFAVELAATKLRAQHFDTVFGRLWLVLNPLLLASVYFVLVDILRAGSHPPGFFAHLVIGIFGYYYVSGPLRDGVKSVTNAGRLILNQPFPRALLPFSSVVMSWRRFVPTLVVYIPIHLLSGRPLELAMLWIVPIFAIMTVLGFGLALFAAAAQVYFRDLSGFLPYGLRIGLYASPVLYFADNVPGGYDWLLYANPFGMAIACWGDVWYTGTAPPLVSMLVATAWAVVAFFGGAFYFLRREREFAVRL